MKILSKLFFSLLVGVFFLTAGVEVASAQVFIYANNGSSYTRWGPTAYWYQTNNEGYCGHITTASPCTNSSLYHLQWTYSGSSLSNYAMWDNYDMDQSYASHQAFIPRVNGTTRRAPYSISYNGVSSYSFNIDQWSWSDQWITGASGTWLGINNTLLTDVTNEGAAYQIAFDEIKISW